jgi:isoleucyl-tRNA synthetase
MFNKVDTNVSFPRLEEEILEWWAANRIVEQSLASGEKPFVFYEGPPTSNGKPGLHHVISRSFKDIILRFRSMQGYKIIGRREGWDTHGLPVEIEVEKKLGFSGKPDIERYGIAEFNARCRESVWEYIQDWKAFSKRIAFWLDEDAYITYENEYIESLWWILRRLWDRDLLFRDYKVTMHCPRCGTSLSDHEVSLGAQDDVDDPSVYIKFRVTGAAGSPPAANRHALAGAFLVAWTTTPWTLPANVGLAVKHEAEYALVEYEGERLVMAQALLPQVLGETYQLLQNFQGNDLVGLRYEPLFAGVPGPGDEVDWHSAYRVIADEMVSLDDGTGIVHIAPAYGDLEIGRKHGLPTLFSVDLNGMVMPELGDLPFTGKFFKQADPDITRHLQDRGMLLKSGRVRHYYPFCWRCNTPLLYYAKRSWYIRTTAFKDDLVANNQQIHWVPEHIRDGRFGNWLANNIDWAISRERYWGTPLPIWVSADGDHMVCIGSLAELEEKVGRSLKDVDLHRPYVDEITWDDPQHGTMRRISDVADCWFDSGSMPVAQWHYPMQHQAEFEAAHPADYICEAVDQTRGWFYTLHAVSTLLFDRPAYRNVICLGHILDENGLKMSKSRGNIVQPAEVFESAGVDALRWFLFSAAPPGNPRRFSITMVNETLRKFMLTLWNSYSFFVTYANLDGWTPPQSGMLSIDDAGRFHYETEKLRADLPQSDQWALARLNGIVQVVTHALEEYDVTTAARTIEVLADDLSNWYVRRNRRRFWKSEADADKNAAYTTLYINLVSIAQLIAPFTPFISEAIYRNLVLSAYPEAPQSVHLARWPQVVEALRDERLVDDVRALLQAVSLGRAARKHAGVKIRQPLGELWVRAALPDQTAGVRRFEDDLRDELNIKTVRYMDAATELVEYRFKPNLRLVGKKYGKLVPQITAALRDLSGDAARAAAHTCEAGQPLQLEVDGEMLELLAEEVLVEASSPEGFAVAEEQGMLVALNTTITPELRLEGAARDLVRNVQDMRKSAGLAINDRISLYIEAVGEPQLLQETLAGWGDYLKAETLSSELLLAAAPADAYREQVEFGEGGVTIGIRKQA